MSINNGLKWLYSNGDWSCKLEASANLTANERPSLKETKKEMKAKPAKDQPWMTLVTSLNLIENPKASSSAFKWFNTKAECIEGVSTLFSCFVFNIRAGSWMTEASAWDIRQILWFVDLLSSF